MGREIDTWVVSVSLSNSNNEQDKIDATLWQELQGRLEKLINDKKYEGISPMSR